MSRKRKIEEDEDTEEELLDFPELQNCDKKTKKALDHIKKEIENTEPNITKILNTKLLLQDKVGLYQLLEVYINIPDFVSAEKLETRKQFQTLFEQATNRYKQHSKYTEEEHSQFEQQINSLEQNNENDELKYTVLKLNTSKENKQVIYNEYTRFINMDSRDDERSKLYMWLQWAISLPHDSIKQFSYSREQLTSVLQKVSKRMDEELYGMERVKEQILLFLNSRISNPNMKKSSLGLIGPPGCGKTTIIRLLADILEYPLEQISLGGIHSPEFLKGHPYTYIGAEPGEIVKRLCKMKYKNGCIFFDEFDKNESKELCSALLHITDSSQNNKFQDNYLSRIDIDLSYVWLIYSTNSRLNDDALNDRIFYVQIDGYTQVEKGCIVKDYLLSRVHKMMNWELGSVVFAENTIEYLVDKVSPSNIPGIRSLENTILTIARKIDFLSKHQSKGGKMTAFNCSFDIGCKFKFPFCLTRENIDMFLDS